MTVNLKYPLSNGFIHNWLAAGPLALPVSKPDQGPQEDLRVIEPVVDLGPLGPVSTAHPLILWRYYRCQLDHLVDFTSYQPLPQEVCAWAYAQLLISESLETKLVLYSSGPVDCWLDGEQVLSRDNPCHKGPQADALCTARLPVAWQPGAHEILLRLQQVGIRATPHRLALQIDPVPKQLVDVIIPTTIEEEHHKKRLVLEEVANYAYLDRYV